MAEDVTEGFEDSSNVVPEGTILGQNAKGGQLVSWKPLHYGGMGNSQILRLLETNPKVYPLRQLVDWFIGDLPRDTRKGFIGTCIPTLEELGYGKSVSTKELNDPKTVEEWSTRLLKGHEFVVLPPATILNILLEDVADDMPEGPYIHQKATVYGMPNNLDHRLYVNRTDDNKFVVGMSDANPEFHWNTNERILLGVRPKLIKT